MWIELQERKVPAFLVLNKLVRVVLWWYHFVYHLRLDNNNQEDKFCDIRTQGIFLNTTSKDSKLSKFSQKNKNLKSFIADKNVEKLLSSPNTVLENKEKMNDNKHDTKERVREKSKVV